MNPFKVSKVIRESKSKGERLIVEELSFRCEGRIRHAYLRMSKEMFECSSCGGFPRHWVLGLKPHSYITLWFYKPPKKTDFSASREVLDMPSFAEMENIVDVKTD